MGVDHPCSLRWVRTVAEPELSRKNPNFCRGCFETAPLGASDMGVGVLFADLRGFTTWCADQPPEAVERALNRFYTVSTS